MKIAIMQPYFLPYLGYFQLMSAVDVFVLLDNVNYIKKGWINRNRIAFNGQEHMFNLPVQKISQNKHINEHYLAEPEKNFSKLLKTFNQAYKKSPNYADYELLLAELLDSRDQSLLVPYLKRSLQLVSSELAIDCDIVCASSISIDEKLTGQDRIIALCKKLGATTYLNLSGGMSLYSPSEFALCNIELNFIQANDATLGSQIPSPSILELLMNLDKNRMAEALNNYHLL